MEKLPICRICLVQNVRMYVVINRNLHKLYEKLTDITFVTKDRRPILACFVCCTKLKQSYQLLRKCLDSEEQLVEMMNEDYECNLLIDEDCLDSYCGFVKSPIIHISIVDECQTESNNITVKQELPDVCEGLDEFIEPMEEHQSDDSDDEIPLMEFKTKVVEEEVCKRKQEASETKRATVAKKQKQDTQRTILEDSITTKQITKERSYSTVNGTTQTYSSKPDDNFKGPYKCDQRTHTCETPCKSKCSFNLKKYDLTKHIRIHTGEKLYKCDVCDRYFSRKGELKRHVLIHTGEKPYKCEVCDRCFNQKYDLTKHIRIHTGEKLYKCDVCDRYFSRKDELKRHVLIHTGEKPYKCEVCDRCFNQKGNLTRHILKHTNGKPYKCDTCERSFSQKGHLEHHMRIHTVEKPYKCEVCDRCFNQKGNLTRHILKHTNGKPYKCDTCERSFSQKGHLEHHMRIHTGEKPYKCDTCERSFNQKGHLIRHMSIHIGDKPYKCDTCERSFSLNAHLKRHIRIHTGKSLQV